MAALQFETVAQGYVTEKSASQKLLKQYEQAEELLRAGDYEKAAERVNKLVVDDPTFIDAHILRGEVYFRIGDRAEAIRSLQSAVALDSMYDPRVIFTMSRMYELQHEYEAAAHALTSYLKLGDIPEDRREDLDRQVEELHLRQYLFDHPVPFDPIPLAGDINTVDDEALPAVTVDGATMLFTRRIRGGEDIFSAVWDSAGGRWIEFGPLDAVNSAQNEGAHSISANGRVLVFTSCNRRDGMGSCDIYLTFQKSNGEWSEIRNLGSVNSAAWDGQPALTADGRGLFFSSDRPGGLGKRDIWYTSITESGWEDPVNLGPDINTPGNESSPFIHRDDRTLYIMSDGHMGMGDYDLFVARKGPDGWSRPENLGYPINTEGREGALTVHPDGRTAYYTREGEGVRTMDIYEFELPSSAVPDQVSYLDVLVSDAISGEPVPALAWIYATADSSNRHRYVSDGQGQISASLPHGSTYGIHITANGYAFYSEQFNLDSSAAYSHVRMKVALQPLKTVADTAASSPVVLRNVEFASNSAELLPSSRAELELLLDLMNENPDARIEIRGHTDNVGTPGHNLELSESRAMAVRQWLISQGISEERVEYRGFGETSPIAANDTEEGRQRNRRTEFLILN